MKWPIPSWRVPPRPSLFSSVLDGVQKKLNQASDTIEKAKTRSRAIGRKLKDVQELPAVQAAALLPLTVLDEEIDSQNEDDTDSEV